MNGSIRKLGVESQSEPRTEVPKNQQIELIQRPERFASCGPQSKALYGMLGPFGSAARTVNRPHR
jgi:hypothetical protein